MAAEPSEPSLLRFGVFELDLKSGEVRKNGMLIKLSPQPFKVLALLARRPNQLVTREDLRRKIWGSDTFVDFEKGLNFCIKQIRAALGDDAETPRYIETLPRRGYRFIAPAEALTLGSPTASSSIPEPQFRGAARWRLWCGLAAVTLLALGLGARLWLTRRPHLAFQQRDWVLITSFENRTGDPVFDGTLEYALEREISNSQFVNVVPRERVADTLRLMRKPDDTRVDAVTGREICLRDGAIRALLTGRIAKLDTTYLLSVEIVDPTREVAVASVSEEAAVQREVVHALQRISNQVRARLGEALPQIQQGGPLLEKATTPSLPALQHYSQGMALVRQLKLEAAIEPLTRAVTEDNSFASANILLALSYSDIGEAAEAAPYYRRAFELADATTDRERYFILGSYYDRFAQDKKKAARAYAALVNLYPDDYEGVSNLAFTYQDLGRSREALPYVVQLANLRPNDFGANIFAARVLAIWEGDLPQAKRYLDRARAVAPADHSAPTAMAWLELFPAYESWLQGNVAQTERVVESVAQRMESQNSGSPAEAVYGFNIAGFYLALGELRKAEQWGLRLQMPGEPEWRLAVLAMVAFARGDKEALQRYLAQAPIRYRYPSGTLLMLRVRVEPRKQVEKVILTLEKAEFPQSAVTVARGELALAQGQTARAIPLLEEGLSRFDVGYSSIVFFGTESLARAYEQQGDLPQAIRVLEEASQKRANVYPAPGLIGYFWIRIQFRLAQLYRKTRREEDARQIEAELSKLLAHADPDHPILVQLKRLQNLTPTQPSH